MKSISFTIFRWVAVVVDKHSSQGKYKIHYPGWDPRWDEWVPKNRLRWTVDRNTVETIHVNDIVELWCCGAHVPGAWLESYVRKVRGDRFCVGKVMATGNLWVERDRLRLVRHVDDQIIMGSSPRTSLSRRLSSKLFGSQPSSPRSTSSSPILIASTNVNHNDEEVAPKAGCSIM